MCPIQAISFLSLHAAFPSFCLVESGGKKTVATQCAATIQFYLCGNKRSMRKFHANVIFMTWHFHNFALFIGTERLQVDD
ncbi:hypothetical protein CQW29_14355 [Pantoea coffeiphila]|uniref:Uncharacterized protein n=1 Tax=Pantoea coffeiphila TaxID=1465635 RepID=A0A2S9IA62_9GAMM|nr:hypothetical protein CQW29_14355 [Pantoea coffeiphila]